MATAPKATFLRTPLKILPRKSSWADTAESLDIPLITNAGPGNDRSNASTYPPPRRLHRWSTRKITALLSEALTVSIAASIFVYAVQVRRYDLIPIESNTAKILQRIAKTIPSFYSILFAKILGSFLKSLVFWKLERGGRVGFFDHLLSSTTLGQALSINSRQISLLGLGITLAWTLSPLGSQASLLIVGTAPLYTNNSMLIQYLNMSTPLGPASGLDSPVIAQQAMSEQFYNALPVNTIFAAAMMTPGDIGTMGIDAWNNVKIPFIEHLSGEQPDVSGWHDISKAANVTYSSLIGIPMSAIPQNKNTSFGLETSYWTLSCPELRNKTQATDPKSYRQAVISNISMTNPSLFSNSDRTLYADIHNLPPNLTSRDIAYEAWNGFTFANCTISTSYVEVNIACLDGIHCTVMRMRKSQQPNLPPPQWTPLDSNNGTGFLSFAEGFVAAIPTDISMSDEYNPYQGYLLNPSAAFSKATGGHVADLGNRLFETRFAQLLNSYLIAWMAPGMIQKGLRNNDITDSDDWSHVVLFQNATAVVVSSVQEVMRCQSVWFVILLASSAVLVVLGLCDIGLEVMRRMPMLELTVSALIKDNPYVDDGVGVNSTAEADERSRALRNVVVRYGDVEPRAEYGYIAIGRMNNEVARVEEMGSQQWKGRLYR
ncbi:MAG: Uncharacterized protein AUREO_004760 [Aureobasidium pullulans]|nr:MAG: Amino acid transporter-like protein [Aureobasidium pullulans]OBW69475.1 MAG: Uncharacterized protein AUREO_004760 [Aureobasidium pullulans]